MDDNFYENDFKPLFLEMVVLNFCQKTKTELNDKQKSFYEILKYALPSISRLVDKPNTTIEESISSSITEDIFDYSKNNSSSVIHLPDNLSKDDDKESIDEDSDYECPNKEDKEKIGVLDVYCLNQIEELRKHKWIAVKYDSESESSDENIEEEKEEEVEDNLVVESSISSNTAPDIEDPIIDNTCDSGNSTLPEMQSVNVC